MDQRWTTERLAVAPWHDTPPDDLAEFLAVLLTPAVTAELRPDWSGPFDRAELDDWVAERDAESDVFTASSDGRLVGLLLTAATAASSGREDIRIGYLLDEHAWGQGLATELVTSCVSECRKSGRVESITAGVSHENLASIKVLERAGLTRRDDVGTSYLYRVMLGPSHGLVVRPETDADIDAIREVVAEAFGSEAEADLVDRIRASPEYRPSMSLVAEVDGTVVGHVMISAAHVRHATGVRSIVMLSPLAVAPARQREGVGGALIEASVAAAELTGEPLVVLQGDPSYYSKFGFEHAAPLGLIQPLPSWAPSEAGQVRLLSFYQPDDATLRGDVIYPAAFDGLE